MVKIFHKYIKSNKQNYMPVSEYKTLVNRVIALEQNAV